METQRLCPVYDKHRFGPSEGAKRLQFLQWSMFELEYPEKGRPLPANFDRLYYDTSLKLREQGAYLIGAGF